MKSSICQFCVMLILCSGIVLAQRKPKPTATKNCKKSDFDNHSSNVFGQFGLQELSFPETRAQLSTYCKKAKESTDFAKQYGQNCLKSTSQTLMSLASYNFEQVNKQYCAKNGKLKNDFIRWGKCGNKAKVNTEKCWDTMIVSMATTHKVKNTKDRIPVICCTYYAWIKCNKKAMQDMGESVCANDAIKGYEVHVNKASVDSMNLICSKYQDDPVKCANLKKELPNERPKRMDKMPLLYIFDIFDKL